MNIEMSCMQVINEPAIKVELPWCYCGYGSVAMVMRRIQYTATDTRFHRCMITHLFLQGWVGVHAIDLPSLPKE